ncbi:ATP-dependent DNA helicase Q-like 5 isoform X2 [Lathyrus oleraceus]|uniref:DNA 3'-5' helicase n=1 Tax=Pisum sativum TaxID=3888 RepID=A0A9D4ZVG2_PEA|nr:ATP-dependent DNA helicase Q-like 5 isoform X2 [Pisum sativum]KAI5385224.1 ATP-dependent DNA helicase Q5 [Pisum sativum]
MQFDSDSDSDGSHVSTTPPRQTSPPPPLPPKPPRPVSNKKSKIKTKPSKSNKPPSKPPETLIQQEDNFPLPSITSLPFQIRLRTSDGPSTSSSHSMETLPAGFFSKSISFSKIRKPLLNLEPSESQPVLNSPKTIVHSAEKPPNLIGAKKPPNLSDAKKPPNLIAAKKPPNLIGASLPTPAVKVLRGAGEGNFVKLNLSGKRKKFLNKGWKKNGKFGSGKRYRRNSYSNSSSKNKRTKLEGEGEDNEEDGLGLENAKQKQKQNGWEIECKVLEEAVLAARAEASDENLVKLLKLIHGYDSFREGQLEAIKNVLAGKSTMLILPTGAGKSLCYQLSALILPGITLVVSPLLALMIDQLKQLPPLISGAILSSAQTLEESSETLSQLRQGTIKVLFVSPERFLNKEFLSAISAGSAVSLVVIDEAHCISEWSHNFRPSFMRLRASLLQRSLNVGSVLAMTATATTTTLDSIMSALDIPFINLIQNAHLRDNLRLSVSLIKNRMKDLLVLIKSPPFTEVKSIIVYCKFQSETDQISRYLNDNNISAKSYHSGIFAKERGYVQELFGSNKIRVVVATVAFGMGLDKSDVGAVIHYSLPGSLEEYVQEIGRAGRDGRLSYCHLFYDDEMYFKLRSLMYSEGVDEYAVNKFLSEVFPADKSSCGKIRSLIKESASRRFDMKEEVILTVLTRLELGDVQYLQLLPQTNVTCLLNFYKTPAASLAQKISAIAVILKRSENKHGQHTFDIPTVANDMGVTPFELTNQLYDLKLKGEITYEMKDMAYCYRILEVPTDFLSLSADITQWLSEVESCKVRKMDAMFNAAYFAVNLCDKMNDCSSADHTSCLQRIILDYFAGVDNIDFCQKIDQSSPFLRADIKVFLQSNSHARFTPRAVARVMHGIASPAYPYTIWGKTHFWGRYTKIDFKVVMEAAKEELKKSVGKDIL